MTQIHPNNHTSRDCITPDKPKRASRYHRPAPIPMILTERDERIIARCWEDKLLRTSDLHTLFFGARARAVHRLRILYSNHYLDRYFTPMSIPYRGSTEALYTVGAKGNSIVSLRLGQDPNYVGLKRREFKARMESPSFLFSFRHLQTVNRTRICFEQAFGASDDWRLVQWTPERLLEDQFTINEDGQIRRAKIRPDGFLQYQHHPTGKTYSAFVEADLGTMSQKQILAKVERYLHYFQTDLPAQKYGTQWFRVLLITTGKRRARGLYHAIGGATNSIFWLTSFDPMETPSWLTDAIWFRVGHQGTYPLISS